MRKKLKEFIKKNRGFTLIELLIIIAIIGILASVIMISLMQARAKARDARRKSDLNQIRTALELYADDHGGKYTLIDNYYCSSIGATATHKWTDLQLLLTGYINPPYDPRNDYASISCTSSRNELAGFENAYNYVVDITKTNYCMWANLETNTGNGSDYPTGGTCGRFNPAGPLLWGYNRPVNRIFILETH